MKWNASCLVVESPTPSATHDFTHPDGLLHLLGDNMTEQSSDVIIVGAGLSGLAAADAIAQFNAQLGTGPSPIRFTVLEGAAEAGGRTRTDTVTPGFLELGGQYLGPTQTYALAMVERFGLTTFDTWLPAAPPSVYEAQGPIADDPRGGPLTYYTGGNYPLTSDILDGLKTIESLVLTVRARLEQPWKAFNAAAFDQISVADWMATNLNGSYAKELMTVAIRSAFSVEPSQISFLYLLYYAATCGSFAAFEDVRGGGDSIRLSYGTKALVDALVEAIRTPIEYNQKVTSILPQKDGKVLVTCAGGDVWRASRVIVALSPAVIKKTGINFGEYLPKGRAQLHALDPMARTIKGFLRYDRSWWRDRFTGYALSAHGPADWVMDNTWKDPLDETWKYPALMTFMVGDRATQMSALTKNQRETALRAQVERLFGPLPKNANFIEYVEKDWTTDPWSGGCPAACMPPGLMTSCREAIREPWGSIHWAGSETATDWVGGYMNGALQAGIRAGCEVVDALMALATPAE
jgi:monoamine oxidase